MDAKRESSPTKVNGSNNAHLLEAVKNLSRVPSKCPVDGCMEIIFPSNLMMHMLHKHTNDSPGNNMEIYENKPQVLNIDPTTFEFGVNYCLGTLIFGGVQDKPHTEPARSFLSLSNMELITDSRKYFNYLPIMVMGCRTTWFAELRDKELELEMVAKHPNKGTIYVFWLVAPKTTRKVFYTMTIYDRFYQCSRSVLRVVRDYTSFQNPSDFLPIDANYLMLRESELLELMNTSRSKTEQKGDKTKRGIPLEVIIYENPSKTNDTNTPSLKEVQAVIEQAKNLYREHSLNASMDPKTCNKQCS